MTAKEWRENNPELAELNWSPVATNSLTWSHYTELLPIKDKYVLN